MQAQDLEVLASLADWLEAGHECHLCTIVATYGSSPRPVGSLLALNDQGQLMGSLSGGCVEDDLIAELRAGTIAQDTPECLRYGVASDEAERMGLPCGGSLSIIAERLPPDTTNRTTYRAIAEALSARRCIARQLILTPAAHATITEVSSFEPLRLTRRATGEQVLRQVYGPRRQLFLIGAGMVSRYLADMAQALEFEVTVCDPRAALLEQWSLAGVHKIRSMPDDAIRMIAKDAQTAIIALTHDPRIDDMGLLEALQTDAFYVGAMGSKVTSQKRRARLRALDVPEAALQRLHAPVGLATGSKTPAEIAIAILAELTSVIRHSEATSTQAQEA